MSVLSSRTASWKAAIALAPVAEDKLSLCLQATERLPIQVVAPRQPGVDRGQAEGSSCRKVCITLRRW